MRSVIAGLVLSLGLGACLGTGQVTSSTGNGIGGTSNSGGNRAVGTPSTGGATGSAGTSSGANTSGGSTTGGGCVTAADCSGGDVCVDGGCGEIGILPSLLCTGVGQTCGAGSPPCCQGTCGDGGFCASWAACGMLGQDCQATPDCCWNDVCDAGACAAACGYLSTPCAHDSDCCSYLGLVCRPPKVPDGHPLECVSEPAVGGVSCTPTKGLTTPQCNLGTGCLISDGVDPCIPAGYICDTFYGVCREPGFFEQCVPGGPSCQGGPDTSLSTLQCIYLPFRGNAECVQPCVETSDCVRFADSCQDLDGVSGGACFGNYDCTDYFEACNAQGSDDGTCIPITTSTGVEGICDQAAADAGPLCNESFNRQVGGFCDVGQACVGGVCAQLCNAGTAPGGPACSGACLPFGSIGDSEDQGLCRTRNCDFTDGGGCPSIDGTPLKCVAAFEAGFPDEGDGLCVQAAPNPPGLGATCSQQDPLHLDACGPGQACAALADSRVICVQLCKGPGTQSTCPVGKSCQHWYTDGVASEIMGLCN